MPDWIRKPSTTAHPLEAIIQDLNGPISLPIGTTVTFRAKIPGQSTLKIMSPGIVVAPGASPTDPDIGRVRYTLVGTDLDTPGLYEVDIVATIPGLGVQPFPEDGYLWLLVLEGADIG
jgi:hypothetical protein